MAKSRERTNDDGPARSQSELAQRHGVTQQAVGKWVRDPRWKEAGFRTAAPWSAAEIERQRAWRRDVFQEDRSGGDAGGGAEGAGDLKNLGRAKTIAQVQVLVERHANLKVDRLIKEKDYIKRAEAEEAQAMKVRAIKTALEQVGKALRQPLADSAGDPAKCQAIVDEALRVICMEAFS